MKPVVDGLEKSYGEKVEFRRLNVEKDQAAVELANSMGIQYVPTFLYVNTDGTVAGQVVGEQAEEQMKQALDKLQ